MRFELYTNCTCHGDCPYEETPAQSRRLCLSETLVLIRLNVGYKYSLQGATFQMYILNNSDVTGPTEEFYDLHNHCTQCDVGSESRHCSYKTKDCLICYGINASESDTQCCYCYDCSLCWPERQWQVLKMTQVSISILFGFGILGLIIIYCKICKRTRRASRERHAMLQQEQEASMNCSTIEGIRDRPPPYSEVCNAPPVFMASRNGAPSLFGMLYNRAYMQEAPPSYPETPKQERTRVSNEPPSSPQHNSIQHI
ncbi:hypothetical protein HN011_003492 [Eciton burchellii]|nr:hypothetical protein HN011_003492 [Eciton burchellii]